MIVDRPIIIVINYINSLYYCNNYVLWTHERQSNLTFDFTHSDKFLCSTSSPNLSIVTLKIWYIVQHEHFFRFISFLELFFHKTLYFIQLKKITCNNQIRHYLLCLNSINLLVCLKLCEYELLLIHGLKSLFKIYKRMSWKHYIIRILRFVYHLILFHIVEQLAISWL